VAVTFNNEPFVEYVPVAFHKLVTVSDEGRVNFTTHGLDAEPIVVVPVLVMIKLAWRPCGHEFTTWYLTVTLPGVVAGAVAVPDKAMTCGLDTAPSDKVNVPDRAPAAVGTNVTWSVQVAFGATDVHVFVPSTKSLAFAPPIAAACTLSGAVPVLVTVIVDGAELLPTCVVGNANEVVDNETFGAGAGVPPVPVVPPPPRARRCCSRPMPNPVGVPV